MRGCRCMSCDDCREETRNNEEYLAEIARSDALTKARDAVIEAARRMRVRDTAVTAKAVIDAVQALEQLEQPPDPLEPVREFLRYCMSDDCLFSTCGDGKLKAAAKALGMEKNK